MYMLETLVLMMVPGYFLLSSVGAMVGSWGLFTKAGEPGWAAFVPGYNLFLLTRMSGISPWWSLLFLVPAVNMIMWFYVCDQLALEFGKGIGTSLGLMCLGFVFFPLLGFGSAEYQDQPARKAFAEGDRRGGRPRQSSSRRV
jgi:hypothetical protein